MTLETLIPKLLSKATHQPNGCLTIGTPTTTRRYWSVNYDGKRRNAHQAVWEYHHGPIPDGMEVCHSCDNTRCINHEHLWLGTHAQNITDARIKGRMGRPKGVIEMFPRRRLMAA